MCFLNTCIYLNVKSDQHSSSKPQMEKLGIYFYLSQIIYKVIFLFSQLGV